MQVLEGSEFRSSVEDLVIFISDDKVKKYEKNPSFTIKSRQFRELLFLFQCTMENRKKQIFKNLCQLKILFL